MTGRGFTPHEEVLLTLNASITDPIMKVLEQALATTKTLATMPKYWLKLLTNPKKNNIVDMDRFDYIYLGPQNKYCVVDRNRDSNKEIIAIVENQSDASYIVEVLNYFNYHREIKTKQDELKSDEKTKAVIKEISLKRSSALKRLANR